MIFSKKLKELRNQAGWSQEQLAGRLDISRQAVAKWEAGTGMPDIDNLQKIANIFNVSLDTLLDYKQATTLAAVREAIDLQSYPKSEKSHSRHDSVMLDKYPDAQITQLVRTKKLSLWLSILELVSVGPGTTELAYAFSEAKDLYYLAEQADRQWIVKVSKSEIESRELTKAFSGKSMVVDGFRYARLKRQIG